MKALPDKLSELILVALDDEAKAHRSPRYRVEMYDWHNPYGNVCEVCLAGAVMAFSLGADHDRYLEPTHSYGFGDAKHKLYALNEIRAGWVWDALDEMGVESPDDVPSSIYVVNYDDNRLQWRRDIRKISKRLSEAGL